VAAKFLLLDLRSRGVSARIITGGTTTAVPGDSVQVPREDLPEEDGRRSELGPVMTAVSQKIDLQSCRDAVVLLEDSSVWFRQISLPFSRKSRIDQVLPFELAPTLPEEACISDYLVHEIRFVPDQTLLLTASVPEARIDQIAAALKPYRIRPRMITPKGYALAVLFLDRLKKQDRQDLVFIHIDELTITLILIEGGKPLMIRSFAVSGQAPGERIAGQIFKTVMGCRQRSGQHTRFDICLAAPASYDRNPVMADIESGLALSDIVKSSGIEWVDTKTLISAILPGRYPDMLFNFCKDRYDSGAVFHKFKSDCLVTLGIGVMVLGLWGTSLYQDIIRLEQQISQMRTASSAMYQDTFPDAQVPAGLSPLMLMQARVKQALETRGGNAGDLEMENEFGLPAADVLLALSSQIPETMDARLTRLMLGNGQVTIAGTTDSFNTVDRLKGVLEKSALFKTVVINSAETAKSGNRILFQFRVIL